VQVRRDTQRRRDEEHHHGNPTDNRLG
jgi:hypothetical protein